MKEIKKDSAKNRGEKAKRAHSEVATVLPEKTSEKRKKEPKRRPVLVITIILVVVVAVAIIFGGANGTGRSTLSNNINDTGVNWDRYDTTAITLSGTGKTLITQAGVYTVTGTLSDGYIEINSLGAVKLILDGVIITNNSGPAIYVAGAEMVTIELAGGSNNTLTDATIYRGWDEDVCGVLFSHDDLVLQGDGELTIEANYEDGIVGKDDLKINSGIYNIDAKDEGIRGRDSIYIVDGTFEITSGGDALKSNNSDEVGKGWVKIDGGSITASADDDGVHAESSLEINGGTIQINKSYEGIEAAKVTINDGEISITASDDGINAAGGNDGSSPNMGRYQQSSNNYSISINGGRLYVNSAGDGIDSNGAVYVNGGTVIVDGPTNSGNGALDSETGVIFNGGSVVAIGASGMAVAPDKSSAKYSISVFFASTYSAGTVLEVYDDHGNVILKHTSLKSFQHASLSSDAFEEGETYYVYVDDVRYTTVTLSEKTTQVGQGNRMMPGGRGQEWRF
ncbi:carbohydrate-binding domain-containing protein [Candidatus Saccharibacteria bacterium]|nr:carbohydrate-binding domain-containing protein [Candidatus Saccharibacteria bacterium]